MFDFIYRHHIPFDVSKRIFVFAAFKINTITKCTKLVTFMKLSFKIHNSRFELTFGTKDNKVGICYEQIKSVLDNYPEANATQAEIYNM